MKVAQILGEPLAIQHVGNSGEQRQRVSELLSSVGLDPQVADRYPHEFSGGQRQRVAIARALVHEPRLIICDEPTSALDKETGARIMELLRETAIAPDRCVIVVTHDSRVYKYADRMTEMEDGRVERVHENIQLNPPKGDH
jgi:putative ABC transport system ATP-binding protein